MIDGGWQAGIAAAGVALFGAAAKYYKKKTAPKMSANEARLQSIEAGLEATNRGLDDMRQELVEHRINSQRADQLQMALLTKIESALIGADLATLVWKQANHEARITKLENR